jgi:ribonuclease III
LGHRFVDITLLFEALTHRSALVELSSGSGSLDLPWNERLEFLGDAVLGLCVSRRLMERNLGLAEGDLSKIRAAVVNEESLADMARSLELGNFIVLGKGAAQGGGRERDSLLADGIEAVIGAVFSDAGYFAADKLVGQLVDPILSDDLSHLIRTDFKTALQELTQERLKVTPTYEVIEANGPDHAKVFTVRVLIGSKEMGRGQGASKKRASQVAAHNATLNLLKGDAT